MILDAVDQIDDLLGLEKPAIKWCRSKRFPFKWEAIFRVDFQRKFVLTIRQKTHWGKPIGVYNWQITECISGTSFQSALTRYSEDSATMKAARIRTELALRELLNG